MNLKRHLIAAATFASVAVPTLAHADNFTVHAGFDVPPVSVHVHGSDCHHGNNLPPPPPPREPTGHYEVRTVSEFVPGRYDQVWVPPSCVTRYHGRWGRHVRQVCNPGYYTQQWIPGRYVDVQKTVWVQDSQQYQYGSYGNGGYTNTGYSYGGGYAGQR